jgi:hypothetical protein
MTCLAIPPVVIPVLGGGLTIPPIPVSPPFDARLCCKIAAISPITLPPVPLTPAIAGALDAAQVALDAFFAAVASAVTCPLE